MICEDLETAEVETPLGAVLVVAGPAGVERVCLPGADRIAAVAAAGRSPEGRYRPDEVAAQAATELAGYFAGTRRSFDLPLDLGGLSEFQRAVLAAAAQIPYGETASYREMAIAAGSPGAVRAAGTAMGANPVPLLIPCHRVIRSDGTPGLYGGGEPLKRWLLDFEAGGISRVGAESPRVARSG